MLELHIYNEITDKFRHQQRDHLNGDGQSAQIKN